MADLITPAQARAELSRRELARRHLADYYRVMVRSHIPGAWQLDLCRKLEGFVERVRLRQSPRMIVLAPPQHGKSTIVSRALPAWILGKCPDWPIILASYAASLAAGHGRWVRNTLAGELHQILFPACQLTDDSAAADQMSTTLGGQLIARGVGGGTTGNPAKLLITDDPFADREEADSKVIRDKVWDWYGSVATTRLAPGGGELIMHTRWHQDDLVGRIIEQAKEQGNLGDIDIVSYPAIADHDDHLRKTGEALHPERYSVEELRRKFAKLSARDVSALYQQEPVSESGSYYKREHLRTYTGQPPAHCRNYVTTDLALGKKNDNDWTVLLPGGVDPQDDLYILPGIVRKRMDALETACRLLILADDVDAEFITLPSDHIGKSLYPFLERMMETTETYRIGDEALTVPKRSYHIEWMPVVSDKMARSRSIQGWQERGKVHWPAGELWDYTIRPELLAFPTGKNDDICDAVADLGRLLENLTKGRVPKVPKIDNPDKKRWKMLDDRKNRGKTLAIKPLFGR